LRMFLLVAIPTDINDNRRHVHVFRKVAGICIPWRRFG